MSHSLADLEGLNVSAAGFLAAVLEAAAQPIWVVDQDGLIRFANPAAVTALGYDGADELLGRHGYPAEQSVASDLECLVRRDGSTFAVSYVSVPLDMPDGRGAVVAFTDIEDRVRAEERDAAAQQASLRRVAGLVTAGAASAEVFAAIAREVGQVVGLPVVALWRYEHDGTATVIGAWSEDRHPFQAGTRWPLDGPTICAEVLRTGRPARIDDFSSVPGTIAKSARETGISACAGAPIVVDGDVWGAMSVDSTDRAPLPDDIEERLAEFTELVATAISNTASRDELARLADEQAALRRVATLVAEGVPANELFGAVAEEVGRLLGADLAGMIRYEAGDTVVPVAAWSAAGDHPQLPERWTTEEGDPAMLVAKTGRPVRIDDWESIPGPIAAFIREETGIRSSVGSPILVEGGLWGALAVHFKEAARLPADTETRIGQFTELVATAISNIHARSELAASRARIAAAADAERRQVVRDLHDGAQQRLVHTVLTLRQVLEALETDASAARALATEALDQAEQATTELRELARGIMPAVLAHGGLRAGVEALASRMPVPVETEVSVDRLPAAVEATAYFVVAEALTNVAKHSGAAGASVTAHVEDATLRVQVRDDGVGGAHSEGSGLLGLADRLAVLDGRLDVESAAAGGTLVAAAIPLRD